jgi:DNA repair photolyase
VARRGVGDNPAGRFQDRQVVPDPGEDADGHRRLIDDHARTVLSSNDSPDVPFDYSVNPYRGCEHGCPYCYARPSHEYQELSPGLDFERVLLVKRRAPQLLREALARPGWSGEVVALSGITDPYQPVERELGITRGCLAVLAEARNPTVIVTKSALVERDSDHLAELAAHHAAGVWISLTTRDPALARDLEPRATAPHRRLEAIANLAAAGVPVGVLAAPIIPGLTDHEVPELLGAAAEAGASFGAVLPLRLPGAVSGLFLDWLREHRPDRAQRVEARVRDLRGGALNASRFGARFAMGGAYGGQIAALAQAGLKKAGLGPGPCLDNASFRRPAPAGQMTLFE